MRDAPVIAVRGLGKEYALPGYGAEASYVTLRDVLSHRFKSLATKLVAQDAHRAAASTGAKTFWALREVSFDVQRGEVFGIIGRNGAGKSTLLKVLSRITAPTAGSLAIRGRVASLLEVGTGFHPELSGRENIYLNGAILGMSKTEIAKKFDAIVDFAEVSQFIDLPVKRYSSGMYVRLAFAVAAHLDPDILILDEVLAVGDAEFQRRCTAKIEEIARDRSRTILIVSHGMGAVTTMCNRVVLLDRGQVKKIGPPIEVVRDYLASGMSETATADFAAQDIGDELASLLHGSIETMNGVANSSFDIADPIRVRMRYRLKQDLPGHPVPNFHFRNSLGQIAFIANDTETAPMSSGDYEAVCYIPGNLLNTDTYVVDLALSHFHSRKVQVSFYQKAALTFVVAEALAVADSGDDLYRGAIPGAVRPKLDWEIRRV